jgi:hypothetical protein
VLDGFQPREGFDDPDAAGRASGPRRRETGTVVKTVPVDIPAQEPLG